MAGFSDLPSELILMLWHRVEVDDVCNFSTASKRVYSLSREKLREHCDLKRRLSTISNQGPKSGVFPNVLKEILVNPRAALYPSILRVDCFFLEWDDYRPAVLKDDLHLRLPDDELELFKQAVKNTGRLTESEVNDWIKSIDEGDEDPLIALLLLLLPNITTLHYQSFLPTQPCIDKALELMTEYEPPGSLTKLRNVHFKGIDDVDPYQEYSDFEVIRDFASIPSVRSISGQRLGTDANDLMFSRWFPPSSSNLTSLDLIDSDINPKSLSEFLFITHELQRFNYIPSRPNNLPETFDPFWIRTALQSNAMGTLKSLRLLPNGHARILMGSLNEFKCLESLETDFRLLFGDPALYYLGLAAILSSSIMEVRLHVDNATDAPHYETVMNDLKDSKRCFPGLVTFMLKGASDIDTIVPSYGALVSELREMGVEFSFFPTSKCL